MQSREIRLEEHTASFSQCVLYSHFGKEAETLKFGLFLSPLCWECVTDAQESWLLLLAILAEGFPFFFPLPTLDRALRFILLKSNRLKKRSLLLGSELRHSSWSLKTAGCFAADFLGEKNQVTEVTDRGRSWSHHGLTCSGEKRFPNSYH